MSTDMLRRLTNCRLLLLLLLLLAVMKTHFPIFRVYSKARVRQSATDRLTDRLINQWIGTLHLIGWFVN